MGGNVKVSSEPGKGTVFTINLSAKIKLLSLNIESSGKSDKI